MIDFERILQEQRAELESVDLDALVRRDEESELNLDSPLAQIVIGVRRSGKSVLCQKVLLQSGVRFAYINFDDDRLADFGSGHWDEMMECQYRLFGNVTHLFVDEVQNVKGWHLFVNRMLRQGMRMILTGSNANLLGGELATYLTGRYHQIELFPFSFREYCVANEIDIVGKTTKAVGLRGRAFDLYLQQGGFPELLRIDTPKDYVQSLLSAIVNKDVSRRYKVRYKKTLHDMANGVLDNYCQEQSVSDLAERFNIKSEHTAKTYLSYLENAYLLRSLAKYSFKSSERLAMRKYYAVDLAFVTHHENLQTEGLGWRLENAVAIELLRRINSEYEQVCYIRKNNSYEVDFAVVSRSKVVELIQVTYNYTTPTVKQRNREIGGLVKAARETGCRKLTLVMMTGEKGEETIDGYKIDKVVATDWMLRNPER